jgi:molybdopterin/thiamine biosynthesis adenylyltransferase
MSGTQQPVRRGKRVVIVGLGAIGSHLIGHVGRMPGVQEVVAIDFDKYERANMQAQELDRRDVGRPKAVAQASRLRRLNPALRVTGIQDRLENLPLGLLRADLLLGCLDSRRARQALNTVALRLGSPWIDAGVAAGDTTSLARVTVQVPGPDAACLECGFGPDSYASLDQVYPCPGLDPVHPTRASSALGALAAALQALEAERILTGPHPPPGVRETCLDTVHRQHYVTASRRNPHCRVGDHTAWTMVPLGGDALALPLADAFGLANGAVGPPETLTLSVAGRYFCRPRCQDCGLAATTLRAQAIGPVPGRCRRCGGSRQHAAGFDSFDVLQLPALSRRVLQRSLRSLGLRPGDVFTVTGRDGSAHYLVPSDDVADAAGG